MPTRVLAFESDTQFSRELEAQFKALGCEITVVDDVNSGLQSASLQRPDLILLTIELPRMSGYSVCNRIKRDSELKDIPLIILSSESTDQTFEQHRRLATRAQDYLHKPVTFAELLEHVRKFVDFRGSATLDPDDDGIVIDDEIEIEPEPRSKPRAPSMRPIDADIEDFTENAFGAIIGAPPSVRADSRPPAPSVPPASHRPAPPSSAESDTEAKRLRDELARVTLQIEEKDRLVANSAKELADLKKAHSAMQLELGEVESLRREIQELKSRPATSIAPGKTGGPSAREFLDLREQLNKKDKELLELRDQITHKEKDLLNVRDSLIAHERDNADLSDKLDELTRQLADIQKLFDAARNDKEAAAKRADDFKRKFEKVAGQVDEKAAEIERLAADHQKLLSERDAERTRLAQEHAAAIEALATEHQQTLADAERTAQDAKEQALAAERAQAEQHEQAALQAQRHSDQEQLQAALAQLEQQLTERHTSDRASALVELERRLRGEFAQEKSDALAELEGQLRDELGQEKSSALSDLERRLRDELGQEKSSALSDLERRLRDELGQEKSSALSDLERRLNEEKQVALASVQGQKEQAEREFQEKITGLSQDLDNRSAQIDHLRGEVQQRQEAIERLETTAQSLRQSINELNDAVGSRDQSIVELKQKLSDQVAETETALGHLHTERQRLEAAQRMWTENQANLDHIKDALAAALIQVEAIEGRKFD